MAEQQGSNPFTNTRLMLAGVVVGLLGAVLSFLAISKRISEATGGTEYVCYLAGDLDADQVLERRDVKEVAVPGRMAEALRCHIKRDQLGAYLGIPPFRNMKKGEPLSTYDFPYSKIDSKLPPPPVGSVFHTVKISTNSDPGALVRIGSVVSLDANCNFGEGSTTSKADYVTIPVLKQVRVRAINGKYDVKQGDKVTDVAVILSEDISEVITRLDPKVQKGYVIKIHPEGTLATQPGEEIPSETKALILDKLGPVATKR